MMFPDFLLDRIPLLLKEVLINIRSTMWLHFDDAPPHYHQEVRQIDFKTGHPLTVSPE